MNQWRFCWVWNSSVIHWTLRRQVASIQRHEAVRRPEIAVVLGNLVLQDQVVAERIPRQIGDQPMILMPILAIVGEDQVGRAPLLQFFEKLLDVVAEVGEEPVPKGS